MLTSSQMAEFLFNIHDTNSIITGGRTSGGYYCPVECSFCMCRGDSPGIDSMIPFITDDELEEGIRFVDWGNKRIYLGDGISLLSAEAFAHPRIYDIIERICTSFPEHTVTIMTTGILIKADRIEFLNKFPNLTISISVNTFNEEMRKKIMPHPETDKVRLLMKELKRAGIQLFDMGDNEILKKDIQELESLRKVDTFQLRRIEHSKFHGRDVVDLSMASIANYGKAMEYIRTYYPKATYWAPYIRYEIGDERKMMYAYRYASTACEFLASHHDKSFAMCVAESSADFWMACLRGVRNAKVVEVKNETYGGSVTVAGLMTFGDIRGALTRSDYADAGNIIVPRIMLNRAMSDLNRESIVSFHQSIGKHPWVL